MSTVTQPKPQAEDNLLPPNPFSRPGIPMKEVRAVVIYDVGIPGASALTNRMYFDSLAQQQLGDAIPDVYASSNYIVGLRGEILRIVPEGEAARHSTRISTELARKLFADGKEGNVRVSVNDRSISITYCHPTVAGDLMPATTESLASLVADILDRHGLTNDRVLRGHDINGRINPRLFVEDESAWTDFLQLVKARRAPTNDRKK